jgi:hypothetical protein
MTGHLSGNHERSAKALDTLRGHIASDKGDGIGEPLITDFLKKTPGINENSVRQQLALLKSSGDYARIISETLYRPSSHGIVGNDGTRRCMTRGRVIVVGFGSDFAAGAARRSVGANVSSARRLSNLRCGITSRASSASLAASTSSMQRQRFEKLNTLTRRGPGSISIRPRPCSSFSDFEMFCRPM